MSTKIVLFIIAGVLVAGLLIAGITATVTYADNGPGAAGGELLDRVAQLLNVDRQKLADAFKQAGTELRQDRMNNMFNKWVTDGKLTQDQANQYKAWLAAKPAGAFGPLMGLTVMDKLLKDGKITQAQYDSWKTWWNQKPGFDLPKPDKAGPGAGAQRGPFKIK
ncbi:MAG: hypothetical protein A2Z02_02295 [Chloroflexi bacterium RBG_16_48_7]|nr:MAG: hypothetical protein A2Z02_02295 [Chloroflexi bacterium RBG_16_48_7]